MSTSYWLEVRGQKFTMEEASEASNFHEILNNFDIPPDKVVTLFLKESLNTARRLVVAEIATLEGASVMLLNETDSRIIAVIHGRIKEEITHAHGDIIC